MAKHALRSRHRRTIGMTSTGMVALACVVLLVVGIEERIARIVAIFVAAGTIALLVILVPASVRTRLTLATVAFVTAAGLLFTLGAPDAAPQKEAEWRVNVGYLASLVREGPFSEKLPSPFELRSLEAANIGDAGAAGRVGDARLVIESDDPGLGAGGFIEIYKSPESVKVRATGRFEQLKVQYEDFGGFQGEPKSFCVVGNREWICGGFRGYAYAEVFLSPDANAYLPKATELVSAQLRYTDKMSLLASS